jgi:hypothetical protein
MINGTGNGRNNLHNSQANHQIGNNNNININNNPSNIQFRPKTQIRKSEKKNSVKISNNNNNNNNNINNNNSINNNNRNNRNNSNNNNNKNIKIAKIHNSHVKESKNQELDKGKKYKLDDQIKKKKELEEEKLIREKLNCFRCYGKVIGATMCSKCQKIACGKCAEIMIQKKKCDNCKNSIYKEDFIKIPFLNDVALFFIATKEKKEMMNKDNNLNYSSDESKEEIIQLCPKHPGRYFEYLCFNCNEFFCSECASFLNQENFQKHAEHLILPLAKLEEFNLKKILEEHKILPETKLKLENIVSKTKVILRELEIRKKRENEIFDSIKHNIEIDYSDKIKELKKKLILLKNRRAQIDSYLMNNKNNFNEFEKNVNDEKIRLLNELKEMNSIPFNVKEIDEIGEFKKGLCIETFKSEKIEIVLTNGDKYIEELKILDKELYFIPDTICTFISQYLGGKIHFNLSFNLNEDLYIKYLYKFYGHIILQNKNHCEYAIFNDFHLKNSQILSVEFEFKSILPLIDENNKFNIVIFITRTYYK